MRIAIIGPGAIGLLFGGMLAKHGLDVFFLHHSKERADNLAKNGLYIESDFSGAARIPLRVTARVDEIGPSDLILISVKSYDFASAASVIPLLAKPDSIILTLQNGLGHIETLKEAVREGCIAVGITYNGVTLIESGRIRHAGKGPTYIGPAEPDPAIAGRLSKIAACFTEAGIGTQVEEKMQGIVWNKFLINVGINAVSALTGLRNGDLIESEEIRRLMKEVISEASRIAAERNIPIETDIIARAFQACRMTGGNLSSMLQDVLNRKRTEIDAINGAVLREAAKCGCKAPFNETLTLLVKAVEKAYTKRLW